MKRNAVLARLEAAGTLPVGPRLDQVLGVLRMRLAAELPPFWTRIRLRRDLRTGASEGVEAEGPLEPEEVLELRLEANQDVSARYFPG